MIDVKIYESGDDNCGLLRENVQQNSEKNPFATAAKRLYETREPRALSAPAKFRSRRTVSKYYIYY